MTVSLQLFSLLQGWVNHINLTENHFPMLSCYFTIFFITIFWENYCFVDISVHYDNQFNETWYLTRSLSDHSVCLYCGAVVMHCRFFKSEHTFDDNINYLINTNLNSLKAVWKVENTNLQTIKHWSFLLKVISKANFCSKTIKTYWCGLVDPVNQLSRVHTVAQLWHFDACSSFWILESLVACCLTRWLSVK